jgi:hypothetical protein
MQDVRKPPFCQIGQEPTRPPRARASVGSSFVLLVHGQGAVNQRQESEVSQ